MASLRCMSIMRLIGNHNLFYFASKSMTSFIYRSRGLDSLKALFIKADALISRRRLIAGIGISSFTGITSDLLIQIHNKRPNAFISSTHAGGDYANQYYGQTDNRSLLHLIDWNRNLVFATWGFLYLGCAQYFIYAKLLNRSFVNPKRVLLDRSSKILFDQFIHIPFVYYPAFHIIKDTIENKPNLHYRLPSKKEICTEWSVWIPAQIITFSLPAHWRLPYICCVSFLWTAVLSKISMD